MTTLNTKKILQLQNFNKKNFKSLTKSNGIDINKKYISNIIDPN